MENGCCRWGERVPTVHSTSHTLSTVLRIRGCSTQGFKISIIMVKLISLVDYNLFFGAARLRCGMVPRNSGRDDLQALGSGHAGGWMSIPFEQKGHWPRLGRSLGGGVRCSLWGGGVPSWRSHLCRWYICNAENCPQQVLSHNHTHHRYPVYSI